MAIDPVLAGLAGGVLGFLAKSAFDFLVSSNKDGFKDHKQLLAELIKNIESCSDQLNKDVFIFYSKQPVNDVEKINAILRIESDFKHLGVQINKVRINIAQLTAIKINFGSELKNFRSESLLNIHNSGAVDFDRLDKIINIHAKYIELKNAIIALKMEVALYQLSVHFRHRVSAYFGGV